VLCGDSDSSHTSANCSRRSYAVLYHATRREYRTSIETNGFRPSAVGRMEPGVYFMSSKDKCVSLAKSAHCGGAGVVAVVEVDLGRLNGLCRSQGLGLLVFTCGIQAAGLRAFGICVLHAGRRA